MTKHQLRNGHDNAAIFASIVRCWGLLFFPSCILTPSRLVSMPTVRHVLGWCVDMVPARFTYAYPLPIV